MFQGSLGTKYNRIPPTSMADGMIYKTLYRLNVLNHEALKDTSKHWLIVSDTTFLFLETQRFIGSINKSTAQLM